MYSGVLQGSILGPLLFLIYINNLANNSPNEVKIKMFADDVKLYIAFKNDYNIRILEKSFNILNE